MAAELFRHMLRNNGLERWEVLSFGFDPYLRHDGWVKSYREKAVITTLEKHGLQTGLSEAFRAHTPKGIGSLEPSIGETDRLVLLSQDGPPSDAVAKRYEFRCPVTPIGANDPTGTEYRNFLEVSEILYRHLMRSYGTILPKVFFACQGNTCRSPMAAEIFRETINRHAFASIDVDCFGIHPDSDSQERKAQREMAVTSALREKGQPYTSSREFLNHEPKGFDSANPRDGDRIVLLEKDLWSTLKREIEARELRIPVRIIQVVDPSGNPSQYLLAARQLYAMLENEYPAIVYLEP
jgi:protein-tyrosine-phosphatase